MRLGKRLSSGRRTQPASLGGERASRRRRSKETDPSEPNLTLQRCPSITELSSLFFQNEDSILQETGLGAVSFVTCAVGSEPVAEEHEDERDIQGKGDIFETESSPSLGLFYLNRAVELCSFELFLFLIVKIFLCSRCVISFHFYFALSLFAFISESEPKLTKEIAVPYGRSKLCGSFSSALFLTLQCIH